MLSSVALVEGFGNKQPLQLSHMLQHHCPSSARQLALGRHSAGPRTDCSRNKRRPVPSKAAIWRGGALPHTPLGLNSNDAERIKEQNQYQPKQPHARVTATCAAAADATSGVETTAPSSVASTAARNTAAASPQLPTGVSAASTSRTAVVIGGDAAACAAAMYLCRQGWHVTVVCGTPCGQDIKAAAAGKCLWLAPRGVNPLLEVRALVIVTYSQLA